MLPQSRISKPDSRAETGQRSLRATFTHGIATNGGGIEDRQAVLPERAWDGKMCLTRGRGL